MGTAFAGISFGGFGFGGTNGEAIPSERSYSCPERITKRWNLSATATLEVIYLNRGRADLCGEASVPSCVRRCPMIGSSYR